MADEEESVPFSRRFRHLLRSQRILLSIVVLILGILMTVLAVGAFTPLNQNPPFTSINPVTDQSPSGGPNYNLIFVIAGPIVTIIGAYLVGAYYLARRKFEHLMLTKSKAEFLRNIPDLEDILWELTPEDEQRYAEKKADLRVRR
ncbi:MAG: DUF3198 domain-containing protein [Thermoplasmata archaeon]|nr:DUF3198 domain-containing protein [Thermoplasmata archaeon]